jgi:hypothetical protein
LLVYIFNLSTSKTQVLSSLSGISFIYSSSHTCQRSKVHHSIDHSEIYQIVYNSLLGMLFFEIQHARTAIHAFPINVNYTSSTFMFKCVSMLKYTSFDWAHLVISNKTKLIVVVLIFQLFHLKYPIRVLLIDSLRG